MNFDTLQKYLACPVCQHQTLIFQKTAFFCPHCRQHYPIINNIPILTPPQIDKQEKDQIQIFNHYYQHPPKPALWQQSMLKRIFHQPFLQQSKTYLDVGCGPSAYAVNYAQKKTPHLFWH